MEGDIDLRLFGRGFLFGFFEVSNRAFVARLRYRDANDEEGDNDESGEQQCDEQAGDCGVSALGGTSSASFGRELCVDHFLGIGVTGGTPVAKDSLEK